MSRRAPDPAAERTARNAQTIKSLLKLEGNKSCADCKRNKHPRWASWNLGIFICIRCSGIHRGMGTHISRVKSVDLDSWTDEQLQSVLMWGNTRANKYWEAKLAPGHVPSEAKMENFIRTKYDSKRWVMDGPIPDPSTLDVEGDDDIPLNLVKEKQDLQRSASQKATASPAAAAGPAAIRRAPQPDLFANDAPPQRANSGPLPTSRQAKAESAPPPPAKVTKPADSLLGLDFFAQEPQPPQNRSASAAPASGVAGQSRPDLKQSILSLYASGPRPQQQQPQHGSQGSISGLQSATSPAHSQTSFGDLNDAFGGLDFSSTTSTQPQPQAQKHNAFAGLGSLQNHRSPPVPSPPQSFGGSFFDAKPAPKPASQPQYSSSRTMSSSSGFGAFDTALPLPNSPPTTSSGMNDLFDFSTPTVTSPPPKPLTSETASQSSVFNLTPSQPVPKAQPAPAATSAWGSNFDAFGSNDAWSSAKPAQAQAPAANDFGWGSISSPVVAQIGNGISSGTAPKVSADEEFGGWSSAAPPTPGKGAPQSAVKPAAGFGAASEDLFSNVWQ